MSTYPVRLPDVGEGVAEAELISWLVNVGDEVTADTLLAEVMTDKATVEVVSPVRGVVLEDEAVARGVEPDGCYIIGVEDRHRPHLAIEVEWTRGGLDKLEIYRLLDVPEVWRWRGGRVRVYVLRGDAYQEAPRSEVLPGIDLAHLTTFLDRPLTSQAIREYGDALRAQG